jgi:methyltransferase-like protein
MAGETYEQLPYESNPIAGSHPDQLGTMAYLNGLEPPRIEEARILELGCASGGNLLEVAESFPEATFVGIDQAPNQVAEGNRMLAALGMKNVRFHSMSFADIPADFGEFDYVIAHGVYSWVSPELQRILLEKCKRHLSRHGIAYISYNTYPGWHLHGMTREIMFYGMTDPAAKDSAGPMAVGRGFLTGIAQATANDNTEHARVIRQECGIIKSAPDWYVGHDFLEEQLNPVYFYEFVARAAEHGLQYAGESSFKRGAYVVAERIKAQWPDLFVRDPIRFEQCVDFAFGRQFRRTLLCHAGTKVNLATDLTRLTQCHLSAGLKPVNPQEDLRRGSKVTFRADDGATFATGDAIVECALRSLAETFPAALSFDALWQEVCRRLGLSPQASDRARLAGTLLLLFQSDSVHAFRSAPRLVKSIGARPVASKLARWQARNGRVIHNRRHRTVRTLGNFDRQVLSLLDGSRDLAGLQAQLAAGSSQEMIRESLERLAANALLVG